MHRVRGRRLGKKNMNGHIPRLNQVLEKLENIYFSTEAPEPPLDVYQATLRLKSSRIELSTMRSVRDTMVFLKSKIGQGHS